MSEVKYKDSGIEWIGQIPEDWKILSNKDILDTVYSGGTPDTNYPELYYIGGIYPFTTISDFTNNGKCIRKTLKKVTERGLHNRNLRLVEKGTILYSIYASIGKVAICDIDTTISQAILALYYNDKQYSVYHYYVLESMYDYIQSYGRGGTQNNINKKIFENLQVPIPPLPTQHRIAEYLDKVIPNIDKQIESYETLSKKYKDLKKSEIYECVTKGLPESRASRGYKDSGIEWIGEIPNDWGIDKLTTICKGLYDGDWVNTPDQNKDNKGIRYLATGNIGDGYYIEKEANFVPNEIAKQNGYCPVEKGSLIMSRLCTPFARTCILPDNYEKYIIAVDNMRMDVCEDSKKYLSYLTQCNHWHYHFETLARGAVLKRISKKDILNTKIPIPPLPEQIKIADYLDKKCTIYDSLTKLYQAKADKLKELKKSLIYEYVTGKKRVK